MTPKEKAEELIMKYDDLTEECDCLEYRCVCFTMWDFKAKQCALIAVDVLLNTLTLDYDYWIEVKKELN